MITLAEESWIKTQFLITAKKKEIERLEKEKWIEIDKIMNTITDGTQWEKRRLKKIECTALTIILENDIKTLSGQE